MNFKHTLNILPILISLFSIQLGYSQEIKVEASLDSIVMEIGDQIWLKLKVEQNKNDIITFPEIKDTIIKGIDVLEVSDIDTQSVNNKIITTKKVLITAFDDSIFKIPPFAFRYHNDTLLSNSMILSVQGIQLDSIEIAKIDTAQVLQIFDIKEPINTPLTLKEFWQRYYGVILIILGAVLFITATVLYIVLRQKNKPFIKLLEKPKEPAHVIAFRKLDNLKVKKLWQNGKEKEYYSELIEIIREYIEIRFHIPTFERTSFELLESIKYQKILNNELFEQLKQTLTFSDLAKFAKLKPLPNENDLCMKNTYNLVEKTKLVAVKQNISGLETTDNNELIEPIDKKF